MRVIIFSSLLTLCCNVNDTRQVKDVEQSIIKFYNWYLGSINDNSYFELVYPTQGNGGNGRLESSKYFDDLIKLGVVHETFIKSERERLQLCDDFFKKINWKKYINEEEYYNTEEFCDFLNYYYWIRSQEPMSGFSLHETVISNEIAHTTVRFYQIVNGNHNYSSHTAIVNLVKRDDKWLITEVIIN